MSRYYGNIWGNRGEATRQGSKDSGFMAAARSYIGSVTVRLWENDEGKPRTKGYEERDEVAISVSRGSRTGGTIAYRGDLEELVRKVEQGYRLKLYKPRR